MAKKLVILGAGESGTGTAILAKKQGYVVFLSDLSLIKPKYKLELEENGIEFEEGKHSEVLILSADEVVKSPGIPEKAPIVKLILAKGIPVISEIEFAARYTNATLIAITGTNGKTTTTLLTYHILKNAGLNVGLGGNIGESFARQVALYNYDYYVLELSSFQLDNTYSVRFHIAILANITPDHLDRYDYKLENYIASKMRITLNQTSEDFFIFSKDDELTNQAMENTLIKAQLFPFSLTSKVDQGAYVQNESLIINVNHTEIQIPMNELSLKGKHNANNSMASGIASRLLEIRKETIRESLSNFENVEHRLEFVATIKGVDYINDSKATNVNSAWYALECINRPIVWIAGGVDKGNDYDILRPLVKGRVKAIICLGIDNARIHEAFGTDVELIINTQKMEDAVKMSTHVAEKGDVVILSPACASFDLFENYEDRGRQFKKLVKEI